MNRFLQPSAAGFLLLAAFFTSLSQASESFQERLAFLQAAAVSPDALLESLNAELTGQNLPKAESLAQDILRAAGDRLETRLGLGVVFAQHGYFSQAAVQFAKAREHAPKHYAASYNLALALFRSKQHQAAAEVLHQTLTYRNTAELHHLLADVYEESGRSLEALSEYRRAVDLEPENEDYWFALAYELLRHRTYDGATATLEPAVARFSRSFRLRLALGITYFARRRYDRAVETFEAAIDLDPAAVGPYRMLAAACDNRARWGEEVVARFKRLTALQPQAAWGPYLHAWAREAESAPGANQHDEELADLYRKSISVDPEFPEAHYRLGRLLARQGKTEDAVEELNTAIRLKHDWPEPHYELARAYLKLGRQGAAEQEFELHRKLQEEQSRQRANRNEDIERFVLLLE